LRIDTILPRSMVTCAGPLATRNCEPRQARKGAAAAMDVCAGVGTVWVAAKFSQYMSGILILRTIMGFPKRLAGQVFLMYDVGLISNII